MATPPTNPKVTVLLPVRNGSAHLEDALASIFAQRFTAFELLVIDDGSTDATPEILRTTRDPRLRVITHPQSLGLVAALNRGLELARGEFIARHDHDDVSDPRRLQKQIDFFRTHPDHVLLGTEAIQTDVQGRESFRLLRPQTTESIRWYLCFDNPFIHSSVMFRRELVQREFGGYAPSLHSEDYALWSRIARARPTANLAEPLLKYREHVSSVTGSMSQLDAGAFDDATMAIRLGNLQHLLGDDASPADARLLSRYRRDFSPSAAKEFLGVFDRLVAEYDGEVQDPAEFKRVRAIQLAELAYRLLPLARWRAADLFRRAHILYPELIELLPWSRIAALFLLGENARRIFLAVTSGRYRRLRSWRWR
ncbi:MAG TPA: glycosyltransferase [Chthoniobacter sp.]|jgi:glycosyltransferase involved in cell wall biosynthesis